MPIQFCCTQCSQPIEVDDEHAGRTAACPYCRHVQVVPSQSTYQPDQAVTARPVGAPPLPEVPAPSGELPPIGGERSPFVPAPRQRTAYTLGLYGLVCTGLALLLFGASVIGVGRIALQSGILGEGGPPSPEQMEKVQEIVLQQPWLIAAEFGGLFFAVAGLLLGIVSLVQVRWNWRGTTSVVVCGLFLMCVCAGAVMRGLGTFGSAAVN